jgi:hypothetical protein
MSDGTETEHQMTEQQTGTEAGTEESQQQGSEQQEKTFTQAEVNKIAADRARAERAKFADYDDLKSKADGAKTLEERLASMETELNSTKLSALRSQIASEYGISTKRASEDELSDAEVILTGATREAMTAQATRFAGALAAQKKTGNVARKEGNTTSTGSSPEAESRELVRNLFGRGD